MNIEYLRYYLTIANASSINQAANQLYMSQQHLNRILTSIEQTVNTKLVQRNRTGISLTENGKIFLDYSEKIIALYDEARITMHQKDTPVHFELRGKCTLHIPLLFSLYISDFLAHFSAVYPNIVLQIVEPANNHSSDTIASNGLYIMTDIIDSWNSSENFFDQTMFNKTVHKPLCTIKMCFCINKAHPFANKKTIPLEERKQLIFTLFPGQNNYTQSLNALFTSANIYQHLDSVQQNNTVCHLPSYAIPKIHTLYPNILALVEDNIELSMYFIHSDSYILTECDRAVMDFTKAYFHTLITQTNEILKIEH